MIDDGVVEGFASDGIISAQDRSDSTDADEMAETADRATGPLVEVFCVAQKGSIAMLVEPERGFQ